MQIEIRRVRPSDAEALRALYASLSAESRRARFLGSTGGPGEKVSRTFCTPDHMHEEGFVAVAPKEQLVGHLCLVDVGDSRIELGIVVADEWQGWGIGRRLFEAALEWARDRGVDTILATCFADNWRVLALLSSSEHRPNVTAADSGVVEVEIPLRGPLPRAMSRPPYPPVPHGNALRRRRGASPHTRRPGRVAAG
jgi:GNAT superfamily N-acetyltransferase